MVLIAVWRMSAPAPKYQELGRNESVQLISAAEAGMGHAALKLLTKEDETVNDDKDIIQGRKIRMEYEKIMELADKWTQSEGYVDENNVQTLSLVRSSNADDEDIGHKYLCSECRDSLRPHCCIRTTFIPRSSSGDNF
jgi:hypothetical protein